MRSLSLSTKIALVSALVLALLGLVIFGIFHQTQTTQASQEMDGTITARASASASVFAVLDNWPA